MYSIVGDEKYSMADYIVALFTILITDSLVFATNSNMFVVQLGKVLLVAFTLMFALLRLLGRGMHTKIDKIEFLVATSVCILIAFTAIVNADFSRKLFSKMLILAASYIFSRFFCLEKYAKCYIVTMRIISITSILMYAFSSVISGLSFIPVITNTVGMSFKSLFIANIYVNYPVAMLRTPGAFWEPGAFQSYLILALIFSVTIQKKTKVMISDVLIFGTALVLTFSTTGIVSIIPLICGMLFMKATGMRKWAKLLVVIVAIIAIVLIVNNEQLYLTLFGKITSQNHSYYSRLNSITDSIKVFLDNPLFGVGPKKLEEILTGFSIVNTTIMHYSVYGLLVGAFFTVYIFRFLFRLTNNTIAALMFFACILLSIAGENFTYSLVFNIILFLQAEKTNGTQIRSKIEMKEASI